MVTDIWRTESGLSKRFTEPLAPPRLAVIPDEADECLDLGTASRTCLPARSGAMNMIWMCPGASPRLSAPSMSERWEVSAIPLRSTGELPEPFVECDEAEI